MMSTLGVRPMSGRSLLTHANKRAFKLVPVGKRPAYIRDFQLVIIGCFVVVDIYVIYKICEKKKLILYSFPLDQSQLADTTGEERYRC